MSLFFKINLFIKKSVEQSKNKNVKNVIIEQVSYEGLPNINVVNIELFLEL